MANLETLELTISGSADKASQGIGSLITSLTSLNTVLGKSISGLMRLNEQLKTLKGFGSIKLPNIGQIAGASSKKFSDSVSKTKKEVKEITDLHKNGVNNIDVSKLTYPNKVPDEEYERQARERHAMMLYQRQFGARDEFAKYFRGETNNNGGRRYFQPEIERYKQLREELGDEGFAKKVGLSVEDMDKRFKYIIDNFDKTAKAAENTKESVKDLGKETKKTAGEMSSHIEKVKKSASGLL